MEREKAPDGTASSVAARARLPVKQQSQAKSRVLCRLQRAAVAVSPGLFASWDSFSTIINSWHEHSSCSSLLPGQLAGALGLLTPPQHRGKDVGTLGRWRGPGSSPSTYVTSSSQTGLEAEPSAEALTHFSGSAFHKMEGEKKKER